MDLFDKYLDEVRDFIEENIRICFIGDRSMLRPSLQQKMASVEADSRDFTAMILLIAINYGGRDEIAHSVRVLAEQVKSGKLEPQDITDKMIGENLYTAQLDGDCAPDVDLIIRPSGEQRLSNFMIWQSAYAEFYYTKNNLSGCRDSDSCTDTRFGAHMGFQSRDSCYRRRCSL